LGLHAGGGQVWDPAHGMGAAATGAYLWHTALDGI